MKLLFAVCLASGVALAQTSGAVSVAIPAAAQAATFKFIAIEGEGGGNPVTNAPYSAQGVTQVNQTLSDGTHISRQTTALIYRDSQGRVRREQTLEAIGPWSVAGQRPPKSITITDPEAKVVYILNPDDKTARKMPMPSLAAAAPLTTSASAAGGVRTERRVEIRTAGAAEADMGVVGPMLYFGGQNENAKTESLGTQSMEGLAVQGTRITNTIPAGQFGNDRPMTTVTERWFSPDLQVVVMRKTTDPQMGETTYQLTNVVRGEPSPDLFQVPADYTIQDMPAFNAKPVTIQKVTK